MPDAAAGGSTVTATTEDTEQRRPWYLLTLGALGVVFGDIGTSPLYAVKTVFTVDGGAVRPTPVDVYGVTSCFFWVLVLVVTLKYVVVVMQADNDGEGGVLSLAALTRKRLPRNGKLWGLVMLLGVIGASLFFGDSVITPAVSVMSAVEGLELVHPGLGTYVVPLGAVIITALFLTQRKGTDLVGKAFGPVMVLWFGVIAVLGVVQVARDPQILRAISPTYAVAFVVEHPGVAFVAGGAIVLCVTGAEALYADMGHFGRAPINRAWFFLVFPSLLLNYMGQGSLILDRPETMGDSFYLLAPQWARLPLIVLATSATVIASQSVISGAFSAARQAERLGYMPRMTVRHTGQHEEGQIYVPSVNWALFAGVLLLLVVFRSSDRLAIAYGLAVTGTFLLTTTLFLVYAHTGLKWPLGRLVALGTVLYVVEGLFFAANTVKLLHGGWVPLAVAGLIAASMLTWRRGRRAVVAYEGQLEGPLSDFIRRARNGHLREVPGTAVYLHANPSSTPLALSENARFNRVIHENVVVVRTLPVGVPHVAPERRVVVDELETPTQHITHLTLRFGFLDDPDVPAGLATAREQGLDIDAEDARYFVSELTLIDAGRHQGMGRAQKLLFMAMSHNAAVPADYYRLPRDRTVMIGAQLEL
ncbi:potassium transporter Kup [Kocuria sp.]|uniref:potassium transporter Kup n=1 Tax=Kocuria sp. TaxID=1871328 RepID=UPI0026DBB37A|nr:KUP/HAK/KT family potassium transporter [Kocuria sp.]MDO4918921.1 KUP/HAK/KT family potassium transporter [Kocuria sp.]